MQTTVDVATAVAAELGGQWSARPGHQHNGSDAFLAGPDGEEVQLALGGYGVNKDRFAIHAWFPEELRGHRRYNEPRYEITASAAKAPQQIARDIARRLLPTYREGLDLARERKAQSDRADAVTARVVSSLHSILGGRTDLHRGDTVYVGFDREARVLSDDVTFTWRVNHGQAVELARFIAGLAE